MGRAGDDGVPAGWAGELVHLFRRLRMTSGVDPTTGKPPSLRQIAKRAGYVPSHVRDVLSGEGRPSQDAVVAVAGALNASEEDLRLAAFYAEQLRRSPARTGPNPRHHRVGSADATHNAVRLSAAPTVLAGRDREVSQLRGLTQDVVRGRGRVVLVEGEPGIGKTTLLDLVSCECADRGMQVLRGGAEEMEQRVPFAAITSCLVTGASAPRTGAPLIAFLLGQHGIQVRDTEFAVTEALLGLIEQRCAVAPVALLIDDLQWADPSSLLVLHRLGRSIGDLPLVLVATRRPVPQHDQLDRLLRSLAARGALPVSLAPLAADAVAALVEILAGAPAGPRLLRLADGAAGNPLYLTELVTALVRDGRIVVDDGVADVRDAGARGGGSAASIPPSLPAAIIRRLGFVSRPARDVLQMAAVLSPRLRAAELATIVDRSAVKLVGLVREAVAAGLLTEAGEQLRFRHELVRQALAADIPATVRSALRVHADGPGGAVAHGAGRGARAEPLVDRSASMVAEHESEAPDRHGRSAHKPRSAPCSCQPTSRGGACGHSRDRP